MNTKDKSAINITMDHMRTAVGAALGLQQLPGYRYDQGQWCGTSCCLWGLAHVAACGKEDAAQDGRGLSQWAKEEPAEATKRLLLTGIMRTTTKHAAADAQTVLDWDGVAPLELKGDLYLSGLTSAEGLNLPTTVGGGLYLSGLTSAEGLNLPTTVGGGLDLRGLTSAEGLNLPTTVGGGLYLSGLTSAEGLNLPTTVGGGLDLSGLTSAEGLNLPTTVGGGLYLGVLGYHRNLAKALAMVGAADKKAQA